MSRKPLRADYGIPARAMGADLRRARVDAGLTTAEVAHAVGLPVTTLERTEAGTKRTRASVLLKYAVAIDPWHAGALFNRLVAVGGPAIAPEQATNPAYAVRRRVNAAMRVLKDPDASDAEVERAKRAVLPPLPGHEDRSRRAADLMREVLVAEELSKRERSQRRAERLARGRNAVAASDRGEAAGQSDVEPTVKPGGVSNFAHDFGKTAPGQDSGGRLHS